MNEKKKKSIENKKLEINNSNNLLKKIIGIDKEILQKIEKNKLELLKQEIQFMKIYITYEDEIINGQENIFILFKDIRRICKELDKEISAK